jgi:uncharacterized damage-inducible protein DinB
MIDRHENRELPSTKEAPMIPLSILRELFNYNYWARDRQLEACTSLAAEEFLRPMGSSFSSLHETLVHLVGAEWVWLERWRGQSPHAMPKASELPTLAAIEERWRAVERDLNRYLSGLSEQSLALPLTYTNFKGETWTYTLWQTLFHLINHQSYHRGQVSTLLRQLGAQPVAVDFLVAQDLALRRC